VAEPAELARWSEPIARFLGDGLLERVGERLRLSARGVLVSNDVLQEFL
jgi:coproporphyrinogen III oxidase-like Fe-S oxidoreductase